MTFTLNGDNITLCFPVLLVSPFQQQLQLFVLVHSFQKAVNNTRMGLTSGDANKGNQEEAGQSGESRLGAVKPGGKKIRQHRKSLTEQFHRNSHQASEEPLSWSQLLRES